MSTQTRGSHIKQRLANVNARIDKLLDGEPADSTLQSLRGAATLTQARLNLGKVIHFVADKKAKAEAAAKAKVAKRLAALARDGYTNGV